MLQFLQAIEPYQNMMDVIDVIADVFAIAGILAFVLFRGIQRLWRAK